MGKTSKKQNEPKQVQSIESPVQPSPALTQPSPTKVKRKTSPATDYATLALCKTDYVNGLCKSIAELAVKYGINENTLNSRICREKWQQLRESKIKQLEAKIEVKTQSLGEIYLENTIRRMKRYEKIIEVSQEQLSSKNEDGIPVLTPDDINTYTLSEQRINAMSMSAHRIPVATSVDVTTKGQSIGESLVTAIAKLRNSGKCIDITMEQAKQISQLEVIEDSPSNPKS